MCCEGIWELFKPNYLIDLNKKVMTENRGSRTSVFSFPIPEKITSSMAFVCCTKRDSWQK